MNNLLILGIKMEYSRVLFRKKMAPTNDSTGKKELLKLILSSIAF